MRLRYCKSRIIRFVGQKNGVWYRVDEYYFNSRTQGFQKTDEEHYDGLEKLIDGRKIECVIVDPSAASFIEVIRRHGKYTVVSAENNVINGIRQTSQALKDRKSESAKIAEPQEGNFRFTVGTVRGAVTHLLRKTIMQWTT